MTGKSLMKLWLFSQIRAVAVINVGGGDDNNFFATQNK